MKRDCECKTSYEFRLLYAVFAAFIGIAAIVFARDIESALFPVLDEFEVVKIEQTENEIRLSGTLNKRRQCDIVSMTAYASFDGRRPPEVARVDYQDGFSTATTAAIEQKWGPWSVAIAYEYDEADIDFYATHSCHPLYKVTNHVASFTVNNEHDGPMITNREGI